MESEHRGIEGDIVVCEAGEPVLGYLSLHERMNDQEDVNRTVKP